MSKKVAIWMQKDRRLDNVGAAQICKDGATSVTLPIVKEFKQLLSELGSDVKVVLRTDKILVFDVDDDEYAYHTIMFFALDHDLLMYDDSRKEIMCCAGRYGIGEYVLYHENTRLLNSPKATDIKAELGRLNDIENTFAILEGPVGYVQTAYSEDNSFMVEWSKDGATGENHFTMEKEAITLADAQSVFTMFLANDIKGLSKLNWVNVEYEDWDEEE